MSKSWPAERVLAILPRTMVIKNKKKSNTDQNNGYSRKELNQHYQEQWLFKEKTKPTPKKKKSTTKKRQEENSRRFLHLKPTHFSNYHLKLR